MNHLPDNAKRITNRSQNGSHTRHKTIPRTRARTRSWSVVGFVWGSVVASISNVAQANARAPRTGGGR